MTVLGTKDYSYDTKEYDRRNLFACCLGDVEDVVHSQGQVYKTTGLGEGKMNNSHFFTYVGNHLLTDVPTIPYK